MIAAAPAESSGLPDLRWAFFGGDVLTSSTVAALRSKAPGVTCVNFYGTTETPQAMAYSMVDTADVDGDLPAPVGRGIDGVQLLVVNPAGQLAGIGERGEISVRTPYFTARYLGNDVLTRQRFIADPFTADSADRLYRTGDLGRYRADGEVEFAGRGDEQVKLRGLRVEPGEIEAALEHRPNVAQATVITREDTPGDRRLVAYVVPREDRAAAQSRRPPRPTVGGAAGCTRALGIRIPGCVAADAERQARSARPVPTRVETISARPTARSRATTSRRDSVDIWQAVLGTAPIGVRDNFFDIGGHSLLAVHLFARIREEFGKNLPLTTLLEEPTIEHIARALGQHALPRRGRRSCRSRQVAPGRPCSACMDLAAS